MKRSLIAALIGAALVTAAPVDAANTSPTATIKVASSSDLHWGGHVRFESTAANTGKATVSTTVVCVQDGRVVYQWSAAPGFDFPLVQQAGLEAVGSSVDRSQPAQCTGSVRSIVMSGRRNVTILTLASVGFEVAAA